jgi:hypothetical protein
MQKSRLGLLTSRLDGCPVPTVPLPAVIYLSRSFTPCVPLPGYIVVP